MNIEEKVTMLDKDLDKVSKLLDKYTDIALEHTKLLNKAFDRLIAIEKDMQDREADVKVLYSKVKDMEKDNEQRI